MMISRYQALVGVLIVSLWNGLLGRVENDGIVLPDLSFLGQLETAYYITTERRTEFFFPKRFDNGMVVHSCLVIHGYSGNEVTCMWNAVPGAGPAPVEPMIYPAEMSGKIHAEWQVMYRDAATGRSIPMIHPVDYWVVAMDYPPDLRLRVETFPVPGSLIPGRMDFKYYVNYYGIPAELSGSILESSHVVFQIQGVTSGLNVPLNLTELNSEDPIEPGSWFTTMTPKVEIDTRPPAKRRPQGAGGATNTATASGLSVNGVPVGTAPTNAAWGSGGGSAGDKATSPPTARWRIPANNHPGNVYRSDNSENNDVKVLSGYPNLGYVEFVLTREGLRKNRRYSTIWRDYLHDHHQQQQQQQQQKQSILLQSKSSSSSSNSISNNLSPDLTVDYSSLYAARQGQPIRVCVWGTLSMDGQKNIFLQQIQHMNQSEFRFTWVVADTRDIKTLNSTERVMKNEEFQSQRTHDGSAATNIHPPDQPAILQQLQEQQADNTVARNQAAVRSRLLAMPHVKIAASPFGGMALDMNVLDIAPDDGSPPASSVFTNQEGESESALYEWIATRLLAAKGVFENVSPAWVKGLYMMMRDHINEEACDIVVYGNSRGYSSNVLITDTTRAMGIPSVTELLNLFVDPGLMPTAVVGPSVYSIEHEHEVLFPPTPNNTQSQDHKQGQEQNHPSPDVRTVVIAPSVDLARFDPDSIAPDLIIKHPHCMQLPQPCFHVGFIARMSVEKNPGLFLQMAFVLLRRDPFMRFTVIGDGDLLPYLKDLAGRLGIQWAVQFVGWKAGDELPRMLKGIDVMVNPSLRAWSETFCIANIEAMAMRIPLVTFAVGGVGEYVQDPDVERHPSNTLNPKSAHASINDAFSISPNAIVLNEASPHAMAAAVEALRDQPALRVSLGRAGRDTVLRYFTVDRQMKQYAALYKELMANKMKLSIPGSLSSRTDDMKGMHKEL